MTSGQFLQLLAGLAMLVTAGVAWSGWWRSWAHSPWLRAVPITAVPALASMLVFNGLRSVLPAIGVNVLGALMGLALLGGLVLTPTDPSWFGPRWFRRYKRAFAEGTSGAPVWVAQDYRQSGESSVDATFRQERAFRPQPPFNRIRLVSRPAGHEHAGLRGRRGIIVYFPQAPMWAAGVADDGELINEIIAAESLQGARKLSPGTGIDGQVRRSGLRSYLVPRVWIDTTQGAWLFESRKAKHVAREIDRRYLDTSRDMYGLPLEKGSPFAKGTTRPPMPWQSDASSPPNAST